MFCFDLPDIWEWFRRRAWWRQGYQSKTCTVDLKCCSNYCLHYGFVIRCLDARRAAFHAVAGEATVVWYPLEASAAQSVETAADRGHSQWKTWMSWNQRGTKLNEFFIFVMLVLRLFLVCLCDFKIWGFYHHHIINQNVARKMLAFHFIHLWNQMTC